MQHLLGLADFWPPTVHGRIFEAKAQWNVNTIHFICRYCSSRSKKLSTLYFNFYCARTTSSSYYSSNALKWLMFLLL
jgi:hypothetical protein